MRLSVVVPFYNVEAYAAQTLRSLRRSAADGVEFLLVDDASTDTTRAILEAGANELPGSRVIAGAQNRGLAAARNLGITAAAGEYVTFLDGDDFVAAGYYPTLLATIERLGCDMVRTDHVQVRGRERTVHRISHGPRGIVGSPRNAILPVDRITSVDAPYAWAGIYHRRLVDSGLLHFREDLRTCEDRPWIWRLHLQAQSFAVVGLLGIYYRRDVATSLTRLADERQFDFITAFDQIIAQVQEDREVDILLPKAIRSYCAITCTIWPSWSATSRRWRLS
jgi:glycosyltransferase involved in cell wall biosynthesis